MRSRAAKSKLLGVMCAALFLPCAAAEGPASKKGIQEGREQATQPFAARRAAFLDRVAFPPLAKWMLEWPDQEVLEGPKRIREDTTRCEMARRDSVRWVGKILSEPWLPGDLAALEQGLVLVRDAYDKLDATYARWQAKGYAFQVCQTRELIAVRITPLTPGKVPQAMDEKRHYARQLCEKVLPETYVPPGPGELSINVRDAVVDRSFVRGIIRELRGGIVAGAAWRPLLEDVCRASDDDEHLSLTPRRSVDSLNFWWVEVGWFTDGKDAGFWTHKREGDAAVNPGIAFGLFGDPRGASWF